LLDRGECLGKEALVPVTLEGLCGNIGLREKGLDDELDASLPRLGEARLTLELDIGMGPDVVLLFWLGFIVAFRLRFCPSIDNAA
jgi:hypothetical protein